MTTRFEVLVGRGITYLLAVICVILAYNNLGGIDNAKFEIIEAMKVTSAARESEIATLAANVEALRMELTALGKWARAVDLELTHRADTQINRDDFIDWCNEVRQRNPSLTIPVLKAIANIEQAVEE